MIILKTLIFKNIMSVGNQLQTINFEDSELTLVLGDNLDLGGEEADSRNGAGKTTIITALSYAIFGSSMTDIKKDSLINFINKKNMYVKLIFEKDGDIYEIERGRKPSILTFKKNGVDDNNNDDLDNNAQGDSRETQNDLGALFNMNQTMFGHIIALNTHVQRFLSLKVSDQREIIEMLLGITLLSEKAEKLKAIIKQTKDDILYETTTIESIKKTNDTISKSINSLKLKQTNWCSEHDTSIAKLQTAISELSTIDINEELETHIILKEITDIKIKIKTLTNQKQTLDNALEQARKIQYKYEQEIKLLLTKTCHACNQQLHSEKHKDMLITSNQKLSDIIDYINKSQNELNTILTELESLVLPAIIPTTYYADEKDAIAHQSNLNSLISQLELKTTEKDPYIDQIIELEQTAIQPISWININELTEKLEHEEFLLKLLINKDSFIRKSIIDQNLTYLNSRLCFYLEKFGLPHTVVFKNDLSVEITMLGRYLDFENLSRGESNRLSLSLSLAFRDVWEALYHSVNLLLVDELIDYGMDGCGVNNSLAVLKSIARDRNKNVFLISQKHELINRVNTVLKAIKENGFTTYSIV